MWCLPYCIDKLCISKIDKLYKIMTMLFEIARLFFFIHEHMDGVKNPSLQRILYCQHGDLNGRNILVQVVLFYIMLQVIFF